MPNPAPGQLQLHWLKEQSTYDTIAAYAATDAVQGVLDSFKIEPEHNWAELNEAVGTASHQGSIRTNEGGKFSGSFLIKPAAAGAAPDIGPAGLKACLGVETITGGTSAVYTLSDTVKVPLQGCLNIASNLQKVFSGGVIEEWTLEVTANALPTISFSGSCARVGHCYLDAIAAVGGEATGQTVIGVDNASIGCVSPGAVIAFTGDNNSNAGYTVTDVDWTAGSANFTITPAIQGAGLAGGVALFPLVPSQTTGGTAIASVNCGLTIDGVSLGFQKFSLKCNTGWGLRDMEAGSSRPAGIVRKGKRKLEGSLDFYFLDSNTGNSPFLGSPWHYIGLRDIALRVGEDTSAKRMLVDLNKVLCKGSTVNPGADVVMGSLAFEPQQNAAAADECSISFT